jgi:cell division protein ZipA
LPEFRWILLGLGVLLVGGIWWWGARRPTQAHGHAQLRETEITGSSLPMSATLPTTLAVTPVEREASISPYQPLRISATDSVDVSTDFPMHSLQARVDSDDDETTVNEVLTQSPATPEPVAAGPPPAAPPAPQPSLVATQRVDISGRFSRVASAAPASARPAELQKIFALRVSAGTPASWPGLALAETLGSLELTHGRYGIFHRLHTDGRSLFCVASLLEPGTFDLDRMSGLQYPGVSLFAVLPGPLEALQTVDEVLAAAHQIAQRHGGTIQDSSGKPLSAQLLGNLRDEVLRFQQQLQRQAPAP